MHSKLRYLAVGAMFVGLCVITVEQGTARMEAEAVRQVHAVVNGVDHLVVSLSGRQLTLHGRIRTQDPRRLSPAVAELIDSIDHLPAVEKINAKIEIREHAAAAAKDTLLIRS
ncbi:MAG: hypothetical protein AAGA23_16685 [Pseudomonadota bacterium]